MLKLIQPEIERAREILREVKQVAQELGFPRREIKRMIRVLADRG